MDFFITFSRTQLAAQGFARHAAETGGQETVWWERGSGPPLVMVHGVNDQAGSWFLVASGLVAEGHRVLLPDLPGHGESAPAAGPLKMTTMLTGFEGWLEAHAQSEDAGAPILVGNSMGAWIALLTALRRPELVSRVVVVNGGPLRGETSDLDLLPEDREAARRLMAALRDPSNPPTPDAVLDDLVRRVPTSQVTRMFKEEKDLESYLLQDERLAEIKTPVDILWGESDRYLGRGYADRLMAGLPNVRLTLIARCGHVPQVECPQSFAKKLKQVLALAAPGPQNSARSRFRNPRRIGSQQANAVKTPTSATTITSRRARSAKNPCHDGFQSKTVARPTVTRTM